MNSFKAETASSNIDQDKDQFSKEQLNEISKAAIGKPITVDFNPDNVVGKIISSGVKDDKVFIKGVINKNLSGMFIVPGGPIERENNGKLVEFHADIFGCVKTPTDSSLNSIEYIEDDI